MTAAAILHRWRFPKRAVNGRHILDSHIRPPTGHTRKFLWFSFESFPLYRASYLGPHVRLRLGCSKRGIVILRRAWRRWKMFSSIILVGVTGQRREPWVFSNDGEWSAAGEVAGRKGAFWVRDILQNTRGEYRRYGYELSVMQEFDTVAPVQQQAASTGVSWTVSAYELWELAILEQFVQSL